MSKICLQELPDGWTLHEWLIFITSLIEKYGDESKITHNADYSVTLFLKHSKKKKS